VDASASAGGSPNLEGAILQVTQTGDHIWIQPASGSRGHILSEEVVADGRSYEKTLGKAGKGILVAKWGTDARSLWLELTGGPEDDPRGSVQRSLWRLSEDRSTWVRETVTVVHGTARQSRIVLRRQDPKKFAPTPAPAPVPTGKPSASRSKGR
jgi:hypothetical protein